MPIGSVSGSENVDQVCHTVHWPRHHDPFGVRHTPTRDAEAWNAYCGREAGAEAAVRRLRSWRCASMAL